MSGTIISLILAGGAGAFTYSRLGQRLGYTNTGRLWTVVGLVFAMVFIFVFFTLSMLHLK